MKRLLFVLSILFLFVGCATFGTVDTVNYDNELHDAERNLQIPESIKKKLSKFLFKEYGGRQFLDKDAFKDVVTYSDLDKYFEKYIDGNDNHFKYTLHCKCKAYPYYQKRYWKPEYRQEHIESKDHYVRKYISTSNADYIRVSTDCMRDWTYILKNLTNKKDFLVLDFRTNGGGYAPKDDEEKFLQNYKCIVCLVDNYSMSAGEPQTWVMFKKHARHLAMTDNIITVGQSNGMSAVVCVTEHNFGPVSLLCGTWSYLGDVNRYGDHNEYSFTLDLRKYGYLGDGKGWKVDYEVSEMEDYMKALKTIGVDTTGIVIQ